MSAPSEPVSKVAVLVAGTVAFVSCLAAYVTLALAGVNTVPLLSFIGPVTLLIPGIASWRNTETIKQATNGPMTETHARVTSVDDRVTTVEGALQDLSTRLKARGV